MAAALMYARLADTGSTGTGLYKKARLGATRLNYYGPKILLKVNGTARTYHFDRDTWSVTDRGRGQAKTLSVDVFGFTPSLGETIILGGGSFSNRLFEGTITRIQRVHGRLTEGRIVYRLTCTDWTYQFANLKVTTRYQSTSATAIAQDLIATFAPAGFTTNHVQTGLEELDDFQVTMQTVPSALQQLCQRIGGAYYIDADQDVHLYVGTDTTGVNPEALTDSNPHVRSGFPYAVDIESIFNRILVEGMGSSVSAQITAGFTSIPMADSSMFDEDGGEAKLEAQRITYTGVAAEADQGCVTSGQSGGGPSGLGGYPSAGNLPSQYVSGNLTYGTYRYACTFVNTLGETDLSPTVPITIQVMLDLPGSPGLTAASGGSLTAGGTYSYYLSYVTADGETRVTGPAVIAMGVNTKVTISSISTAGDARVTARRIYRSNSTGGDPRLLTTIADNVTTSYVDTASDASIAGNAPVPASPPAFLGTGKSQLVGIPVGPLGTTARKIYRTEANATTLKLLTTLSDNTTTTYLDNTADASLGADATGSTLGAAAGQTTLRLSDLSVVPDGGWLRAGSQVLYFTARSATSGEGDVTGIPASGTGCITAQIPAGSAVTVEPHLTGIPASGGGAIAHTITQGASINLLVTAEDLTSQGIYGIREDFAQDRRLSADGAMELAEARLALLKDPRVTISEMPSTDPKLASGRPVVVNFSTWGITASVTVQSATIRPSKDRPQPMLSATLASRSLDDLYAQLRDIREQLVR